MTCLFPRTSSFSDSDQPSSNPILTSLLLQSLEHLRQQWRLLGLDAELFHDTAALRPLLQGWNDRQLHRVLQQIVQLYEAPDTCRSLALALDAQQLCPAQAPDLAALVLTLQPLLRRLPQLESSQSYDDTPSTSAAAAAHTVIPSATAAGGVPLVSSGSADAPWSGSLLALSLLDTDLSIRTANALRRNGYLRLADLAGVDEERLQFGRNIGAAAIAELRVQLDRLGLSLPFSPVDALHLPLPASVRPPSRHLQPGPWSDQDVGLQPWLPNRSAASIDEASQPAAPSLPDDAINRDWCDQAAALIRDQAQHTASLEILRQLLLLCEPHPFDLADRREELHQFLAMLQEIEDRGQALGTSHLRLASSFLQRRLLEHYALSFSGNFAASAWLRRLRRALRHPQTLPLLLLHACGVPLSTQAERLSPQVSRERARQIIQPLLEICGCSARQFREDVRQAIQVRDQQQCQALFRRWIAEHGRLPHGSDAALADLDPASDGLDTLLEMASASLQQRLLTYAALELEVPDSEWDLHLQLLLVNADVAGQGYWHRLDPLAAFLPRFAEWIGQPGLMPLQTSLPAAIKGAVQRHGGQSAVARALGLTYQGQLVGENGGRTYWTDSRLHDLLAQTAVQAGLPADAMPDRAQIAAFLVSGVVPEYHDKQANSVFAALSRQSSLSWPQVAERFGRRILR